MSEPTYRILMVCTGNICRSPVMERLLTIRLRERLGSVPAARFAISSAGTWAMTGEPMSPEAAQTLVALGGDDGDFVARDLDVEMIAAADLILTAAREHRAFVVTADPAAVSRTLTLRELARLLGSVTESDVADRAPDGDPVARMSAIVAAAMAQRGLVPVERPNDDDIADPYGRDRPAYLRAASEIAGALDVIVVRLAGPPG